jgi:multidrug resistance efflux pump
VRDRLVNPGALVSPQSQIVTLIPPDVEVDTTVDATQLRALQIGQPVRITTPTYPDQTFTGKVTNVAPAVDPKTQTGAVRITPDDPQHDLKIFPGTQVLVTFAAGSTEAKETGGAQ